MSVSLVKGQKVSLSKDAPNVTDYLVGLGWDANKKKGLFSSPFDLDASAFMLRDGKLRSDDDIIYFGNKKSSDYPIWHHGDNLTGEGDGDDEQITVKLDKLDSDVDRIVFVVNIYDSVLRRQTFGDVKNAFIRLVDDNCGKELFRYDLSDGSVSDTAALIFAEIYKHNGEWKFNAIGEGAKETSVKSLAKRYK